MIDISKMSLAELTELRRAINAQIKNGEGYTYKHDILTSDWFKQEFGEEVKKAGVTESTWYFGLEAHIFWLCDLSLKNYTTSVTKKHSSDKTIRRNTSNLGTNVNPDEYRNMVNDILEVIKKYHKKEEKDGRQR